MALYTPMEANDALYTYGGERRNLKVHWKLSLGSRTTRVAKSSCARMPVIVQRPEFERWGVEGFGRGRLRRGGKEVLERRISA
jgi:hypothetical protein